MKWIVTYLDGLDIVPQHVGRQTSKEMCIHFRHITKMKNLNQLTDTEFDRIINDSEVVRFCVVRNPYSRLVSAWAEKIRLREPGFDFVWKGVAKYTNSQIENYPKFVDFANWVVDTNPRYDANLHWQPMTLLLLPDLINYNLTIKTENIASGLEAVLKQRKFSEKAEDLLKKYRTNVSLPVDWKSLYCEELANKVYNYYQEDFQRFNYDRDSWKEASKPSHAKSAITSTQAIEESAIKAIQSRNQIINALAIKNQQLAKQIKK